MGQKNSDRLRTTWTLEMDRYFIDLMLEQVEKGKRTDGHLFSKRAWKHMTTLLNTKFKFHYEKDVLKNRHKTLRNLYKAIRNLLSLNGFSWDHNRHMVTADNQVWDDYIKGHPGARSYRIKTIPYYYDLCQIYKDVSSEGNADISDKNPMKSLSESVDEDDAFENTNADLEVLHEIMIDEDVMVSVSKESDGVGMSRSEYEEDIGRSGSCVRTYWQPTMDRYFIDLMVDQVQKGNQVDGLFRKQAWIEMTRSFNARFGFKYDVDILKNRFKTCKRQYNVINKLLESQGFSWDDLRHMVIADDLAWQDYIEANSDARQYMTRPVPYYKDLCIIFKEADTDEKDSSSDTRSTADLDIKRQLENNETPGSSKKPRVDEERLLSALQEMSNAVSCLVEKSKLEVNNSTDVESVIAAVQALPDMDDDFILDACDFLEDDNKAKTFLALDVRLRRKWLIRKLRPQNSCIN